MFSFITIKYGVLPLLNEGLDSKYRHMINYWYNHLYQIKFKWILLHVLDIYLIHSIIKNKP